MPAVTKIAAAVRELGTVRSFDPGTGYGFAVSDRGDPDVWVHVKNIVANVTPHKGARIEFTVKKLPDRRSEALNVRII